MLKCVVLYQTGAMCSLDMCSVKDILTMHVACRLENHSVLVCGTRTVLVCVTLQYVEHVLS